MPVDLTIRPEIALVVWRLSGNLQAREIVEAAGQLPEAPAWHVEFDELIVIERSCELSAFDLPALCGLRDELRPMTEKAGRHRSRSAIVAEWVPQVLVAKLWGAINDGDQPLGAEYAVFTATSQALEWLGRPIDALRS